MATNTQIRKIKCPHPHCGWEREIQIVTDGSTVVDVVAGTSLLMGVSLSLAKVLAKIKDSLQDKELKEANAWILMGACPNPECKHTYEYNVKTGATRP